MLRFARLAGIVAAAFILTATSAASAKTLRVAVTDQMVTRNPYGHSTGLWYSIWCQVYGCLGSYDWETKQFVGDLAESWEIIDPKTIRFHLRKDVRRQDGGPPVSPADIIHSWIQLRDDPDSFARSVVQNIAAVTPVDDHTVDIRGTIAATLLMARLFDHFAITSKQLFDQYGKAGYDTHPYGWGPYKLTEFVTDTRTVLQRKDDYPGLDPTTPDTAIFLLMREPDQRVAALLNGEIQIATLIPPQLVSRLKDQPGINVQESGSTEWMFLGLNVSNKPWDDVRVRQAAAHAIDRDLIIRRLFGGLAERLDGPVGPNQLCYEPGYTRPISYDPALSKKLLAEAGFASGGPSVDIFTANGRYVLDKSATDVIAKMLKDVGFDPHVKAPEWANFASSVQKGTVPAFYMGRGQAFEPAQPAWEFFVTGVMPRIRYSNPQVDALFKTLLDEADTPKRCALLRQASQIIVDDAPMIFLWSHKLVYGFRNGVTYPVNADGQIKLSKVRM